MYTFLSSTFLQSSDIEYEVDLLPNMALKVLRKENSKKNMVFIEMENRQKYITLIS